MERVVNDIYFSYALLLISLLSLAIPCQMLFVPYFLRHTSFVLPFCY